MNPIANLSLFVFLFIDSPHITEALIGGLCTAIPFVVIGYLQNRDTKTKLVLKVEQHEGEIGVLKVEVKDHGERIIRLETTAGM